jgi:selenocysteine lyase/cysteine desulfurase
MGGNTPVGAVRLSVGIPTTTADIDRALDLIAGFAA